MSFVVMKHSLLLEVKTLRFYPSQENLHSERYETDWSLAERLDRFKVNFKLL